jgi:DNA-binding transcriptional ArsR family regulator
MALDVHRSDLSLDGRQTQAGFELFVDWAPVYELLVSFSCFVCFTPSSGIDLGPTWAKAVHQQLSPDFASRLSRKSLAKSFKEHDEDLLVLLARACPGDRDVASFLDWFAQLTPGAAYEALAPLLPEDGPRLPRDFIGWRDWMLDTVGTWYTTYFRHVEPGILEGLRQAADTLRERVETCPSLQLVEEVTNGLVVEPSEDLHRVTLVPQYHHRPYIHHASMQGGLVLLYPVEALPTPDDLPPLSLLRLTRALSDESRLRILRFLAKGPCSLTEAARFAGLSQPTVHHHLTQLRAAGLVRIHFVLSSPSRYSLRPHALEQLSSQLGSYLEPNEP